MINDYNDIYDRGLGPGDPTTTPIKPVKPGKHIVSGPIQDRNLGSPLVASDYDPEKYIGYLTDGLHESQGDPDLMRGEAQSAWDKWGNMLAGAIPKIVTSFAENLGYLGNLPGMLSSSDDNDFSNGLVDAARQATSWIDEQFPMYRRSTDTFGLTDAAWWTQNIQNLGVSATGFAAEGIGFAKLFGLLGKGAEALNAGVRGIKVANKATELLTSGALAYTEGAQMGKQVYDKTYKTQISNYLNEGLSLKDAEDKAKHIAAQSAATTVQLNTMINTGLNLEMLSGLFKHKNEDAIRSFWIKSGKQAEGESFDTFAKRVKAIGVNSKEVAGQVFKHEGLRHYGISSLSEGIEELTNNFAQRTGEDLGQQWDNKNKSGRTLGIFEQLGELSHYFNRTMDADGALSFVLGAFGGAAQSAILDNVPIHTVESLDPTTGKPIQLKEDGRIVTDGRGNLKYQTERVSARSKGKYNDRKYFNNVRDAIVEDLNFIDSMKMKIQVARSAGHEEVADALNDQLFNAMNFNAIHMGMASNYAQTYREIANTDNTTATRDSMLPEMAKMDEELAQMEDGPVKADLEQKRADLQKKYDKAPIQTEAMRKGYAKDANDDSYKDKAEEAIRTLNTLQGIYDKVQTKYGGSEDPAIQDVADIIANRKMSLFTQSQSIQRLQKQVDEQDQELSQMLGEVGTVDTHNEAAVKYNQNREVLIETGERLLQQYNMLLKARKDLETNPDDKKAGAVVDNMIRKFSAVGRTSKEDSSAADDILGRLKLRIEDVQRRQKENEDSLFNSSGYNNWITKNPGKKFEDYTEAVSKKHGLSEKNLSLRAFLEEQKMEHEEAARNLLEIESTNGIKKIRASAKAFYQELNKRDQDRILKDAVEAAKRARAVLASKKNLLRGKHRLQKKYLDEMTELQDKYDKAATALERINRELMELTDGEVPMFFESEKARQHWETLVDRKEQIEESMKRMETRLIQLQSLYEDTTKEIQSDESELEDTEAIKVKDVVDNNDEPADRTQDNGDTAVVEDAKDNVVTESVRSTDYTDATSEIEDAAKELHFEVNLLPTPVQKKVIAYSKELIKSGVDVNMDFLIDDVKSGTIDTEDAGAVLLALSKYLQIKRAMDAGMDVEKSEVSAFSQQVAATVEENRQQPRQDDDMNVPSENPFIGQPDSEVPNTPPETTLNDEVLHSGTKRTNIIAANTLGLAYNEFFNEDAGEYQIMSDVHGVNERLNPDIENPTKLKAGTKVFLSIDTDYNGKTNFDFSLEMDDFGNPIGKDDPASNYLDEDGKVKEGGFEDVPIKITDEAGKIIGWLPRTSWLNARFPGATNHRNIVDEFVDREGNVIDNFAIQEKQLHKVRTAIVEAHNSGKRAVETTITSKGAGMLVLNREVNKNTEKQGPVIWAKANKALTNPGLKMAIIKNHVAYTGIETEFPGSIVTNLDSYEGMTVALLPAPNGQYHVAALRQKPLFEREGSQVEFNTMVRAIEIFLSSNSEDEATRRMVEHEVALILDGTGYDISTDSGLRNYINQYHTYTRGFRDDVTTAVAGEKDSMRFLFAVDNRIGSQSHGDVRIGVSFSGKPAMRAKLTNGKLDPEFTNVLRQGIANRPKNIVHERGQDEDHVIKIHGLNFPGTFRGSKMSSNGVWTFKEYPSYNEYVKDNTTTNVVENKLGSRYIYAVHPQIEMDVHKIIDRPKVVIESTSIPDKGATEGKSGKKKRRADKQWDDSLSVNPLSAESNIVTIKNEADLKPKLGSIPVSYEALQERYNFTPLENRNGKTVNEVLDDLQRQGLPFISEDYNPFSQCK